MIKLTIDNKEVEVEEGSTILQAVEKLRIPIPTLCYHEALTPIGSCRLCSVEVMSDGKSDIVTACDYPAEEGMTVSTGLPKVIDARKTAAELLLARCPGSPDIQLIAKRLGVSQPRFTIESEDCILCQRCVKTCREIVGVEAISFITTSADHNVEQVSIVCSEERCIGCGSCAYACPTDAITMEDVGATRRISMQRHFLVLM